MVSDMRASGKTTCRTALERKNLKTDQSMTVCSRMVRNGDKEPISGQMNPFTSVTGLITILKVRESTGGLMVESTKANGKRINSTEKVSTLGLMVGCITETMRMTRSMDSAPTPGPMEKHTRDSGKTASSTAKLNLQIPRAVQNLASGKMERESSGWTPRVASEIYQVTPEKASSKPSKSSMESKIKWDRDKLNQLND
jgi:hypothetical protein